LEFKMNPIGPLSNNPAQRSTSVNDRGSRTSFKEQRLS